MVAHRSAVLNNFGTRAALTGCPFVCTRLSRYGRIGIMASQIKEGGRQGFVVAIDGPAGAGKSTVAAHLARCFGLLNLETGAMYRALALKALRTGTAVDDGECGAGAYNPSTHIKLEPGDSGNRVLLDGDCGDGENCVRPKSPRRRRTCRCMRPVREWMVRAQRSMGLASPSGVVMEGRDIGTVVFPDAAVKFFLDASVEARGDRRFAQQPEGESRDAVVNEMRDRDSRDRTREQSPLKPWTPCCARRRCCWIPTSGWGSALNRCSMAGAEGPAFPGALETGWQPAKDARLKVGRVDAVADLAFGRLPLRRAVCASLCASFETSWYSLPLPGGCTLVYSGRFLQKRVDSLWSRAR